MTLGVQARLDAGAWSGFKSWLRPLAWLGGCSNTLYLFHPLVKAALQPMASQLAPDPLALLTVAAIAGCVVVAAVMHRWVELPAQNLGKLGARWLTKRQAA